MWKILETSNRRRREPSKVSGSDGKWENKKKRRDKSGGRSGAWGTREDRRDVSWSVGWARVERMNGWMDSAMKPLKRKHAYSVSRSLPRLLRSSRGTSSRLFRITAREPNLTFAALILFFFFFLQEFFFQIVRNYWNHWTWILYIVLGSVDIQDDGWRYYKWNMIFFLISMKLA